MSSRNNLIDGWRGVSVLAVVVGHFVSYRVPQYFDKSPIHAALEGGTSTVTLLQNIFFRLISPLGAVGVAFFFVISGYLITYLLLREERQMSKVGLCAFYIRRIFRILPAFYAYILGLILLRYYGLISFENEAIARSVLFVCNASEFKCSWWLGHTWSLSVEEQFYLIWPFALLILRKRKIATTFFVGSVMTVSALYGSFLAGFAYIAVGSLVAYNQKVRLIVDKIATRNVITICAMAIVIYPVVELIPSLSPLLSFLEPILVAVILFGTVAGRGPFVALVSLTAIQRLGVVSYSVYLWQQVGMAPLEWGGLDTGAGTLYASCKSLTIAFCIPALISYFGIERPMIAFGHKCATILYKGRFKSPDSATRPT